MKIIKCFFFLLFVVGGIHARAQEKLTFLRSNKALQHKQSIKQSLQKTTALSLPFFDDFTGYSLYPDNTKWVEDEVYINNTMCVSPVSRGVATMDALNSMGIPYDSFSNYNFRYADSLTSQPIDLSTHTPADSIYLSFFYQPQGRGFSPIAADSLMLFVHKNNNVWKLVWTVPGSSLQPFRQVMIPITDTTLFYSGFQFRFVNIAALNYSDAVWNIDYVRMNSGRNMYDTAVNDIAFTATPTFLLNDYSYMPYRQFMANPAGERAAYFSDSLRNNYSQPMNVNYGYVAKELTTGTTLNSSAISSTIVPPMQTQQLTHTSYAATVPITGAYQKMVFENKSFIQSVSSGDPRINDTIVCDQVFDNYLAYDDGSAELSYYLDLSPSYPGSLAIEYHLNRPDTMRGMAIYFGRQAPPPVYKQFSIAVYSSLAGVNASYQTKKIFEQDYLIPAYVDTVNDFWVYRFDTALPLPSGIFYAGTIMPDYSDSLYYGFDANRVGGNHAYYNVLGVWNSSQISGAIMMRPLLGQPIVGTSVEDINSGVLSVWQLYPNPAKDNIRFNFTGSGAAEFSISDITGRAVKQGHILNGGEINISDQLPGIYVVRLAIDGVWGTPQKIVKQ